MEDKIVEVGSHVVQKFIDGVNVIDNLVGGTLGPAGRNRIIYRKYAAPEVTNDGVTIARNAYLKDEIEDLAAQTLVEIAMKTNDQAGDGTTTSIVIGAQIVRTCMEKLKEAEKKTGGFTASEINPAGLSREIRAATPEIVKMIEEEKQELTDERLDDVISTSLENLEYGKTLGELFRTIGKDGYVSVEDNWGTKYGIETETTTGMRFYGTYASPYLATEHNQKEAMWENTYVLVTNHRIEMPTALSNLIKEMQTAGKNRLVIIGGHSENTNPYSKEFIAGCARVMEAAAQGNPKIIQILAVKAPTLTSAELEDVAVFCNAKFIDKALGMELQQVGMVHLGQAQKIVVDEDDVNIVGGAGDTTQRIEVLKEQVDREKDAMFKEKTLRRIASLAAGVGIIRVGAATEQERTYLKRKLEDAKCAAKAAMEEGVVRGGGLVLKKIAEQLGKEHILYEALMAPYARICANAGVTEMEIPENVVDAHKVVRLAFANAASAAGTLITCDGAIAVRRLTLFDYFEKKLGKLRADADDFRDDENLDKGRRQGL